MTQNFSCFLTFSEKISDMSFKTAVASYNSTFATHLKLFGTLFLEHTLVSDSTLEGIGLN